MATKSFSHNIIINSSRAIKLLKTSIKKGTTHSERKIAPKGSKIVSDSQVISILRDY
jgi:hypothetical protein